jgi:hypothetical protein
MGASSVTGISGHGSAEAAGMKGPGNGRNQYVPLVSPHIIAAGNVVLASGSAVVSLPSAAAMPAASYAILATGTAAAARVSAVSNNGSGNLAYFTITGTGTDSVAYAVVLTGAGA